MGNKKDIGDIYKKEYTDFEIAPDEGAWDLLELKNEKMRFYRFSWTHFNIYYFSAIILFSMLSIFSFVRVLSYDSSQRKIGLSVIQTDSIKPEVLPVDISKKTTDVEINSSAEHTSLFKEKRKYSTTDAITKSDSLAKVDSIHSTRNTFQNNITKDSIVKNSPPSPLAKKAPKRRVVIIEQRDTIIQVDTLISRKRRNK